MGCVKVVFFILYTFLCQLAFASSSPHLCPKDQALALLQFKHMFTINPNASDYCLDISSGQVIQSYPKTLLWNKSTDCCSWDGVHCDETTGQVIELALGCSELQGKFHSNSSLFQLFNLKRLDLSYNNFSGSLISPKFGEFSSLTHLYLSGSSFTGLIPSEMSHLSKLHVIFIWNPLDGLYDLSLSLGPYNFELLLQNLTQLRELALDGVNISSTMPSNFCSHLTTLELSYTHLHGVLPERVFHLSNLKTLDLSYNYKLTVRFPITNFELLLKNLTQLRELNLDYVNISSTFSLNFSSHLTTLWLADTQLRGILPERAFHLSNLESLDLSYNPQLTVRFPTTKWSSSASLMKLYLYDVNFTGRIPESFSLLTSLHELDMGYSNLAGPIPKPLWNLTHIESLFLNNNHLEGPISQFSIFEKLKELSLGNNNFDGQLEFLSFNISWTQPELLDFSSNFLTGPIPTNVSGLQNLQSLYLSSNHLNGTIPSGIFSLPSLRVLDLSNNTFSGKIQEFKSNTLSEVDLRQNQLQGPLPNSLLNQPNLAFLLLSHNKISGQIASTICNLKTLVALNLGSTNLEGTIPKCLVEMNNYLWNLDLSNNSLSGTINTNISVENYFRVIRLHGNKLTGKVPRSLIN
ncbi:hypothetical protein RDI58_000128 [Solanum bulbocastanum]|uniref:Leucine-rich repeat-containing N-terminal plant-type domain-containing protein n=1 Tax=Solanum bulbocastanum TaxID=147425 RepID=A0AAN8YM37_SOLBU